MKIGLDLLALLFLLNASAREISTLPAQAVHRYTAAVEFDFLGWTLDAFAIKFGQAALDTPYYFNQPARHRLVLDYMQLIEDIARNENRLNLIYTDPSIEDPQTASTALRAELAGLYEKQRQLAPMAEAILEQQLSVILDELDLTTAGQPLPPVLFHISALPDSLIVSRRERIEMIASVHIVGGLPVDQQAALEEMVDRELNVSSLVVPVGGLSAYPAAIVRTSAFAWLVDTIAHEWTHHWLAFRPLGMNYNTSPELRTMNETTASIAGGEIATIVLRRYYPEKLSFGTLQTIGLARALPADGFNFNAEMHATRVHADELLAAGKIEEAEAYLEQRRQFFWEHGYGIRKLNQAYFAFYGAYADVPGGAAGEDPVGPAVRALRAQSPSITAFLKRIAAMSSFQELQAAVSP